MMPATTAPVVTASRIAPGAGSRRGHKQRHHMDGSEEPDEKLAAIQCGGAKQGGPDVPQPLRGKGRRNDPA